MRKQSALKPLIISIDENGRIQGSVLGPVLVIQSFE